MSEWSGFHKRGLVSHSDIQSYIERIEQLLAAAESRTCELQENSDTDSGAWLGECGATWTFIDNDPKQNSCVYCPQCGGKLVIAECSQQEDSGSEGE